ncbi:MAG: hypothetical protein HZB56_22700 [Deltaproteobacteria bacterium]|nr:hypothetical protein [Deltaproteobacteria bacterium]
MQLTLPIPALPAWCPAEILRFQTQSDGLKVRMSLDGRILLVACLRGRDRAELGLAASGQAFGSIRIRTRTTPFFLAAIESDRRAPIHWGLHRGGPPRDPADFFGYALEWGVRKLAGHRRPPAQRAVATALRPVLGEGGAILASGIDPGLRREVLAFRPDLRVRLLSFSQDDERGWLRQAVRACPGALLFGLALADRGETVEGGVRLLGDLRKGRRLPRALDAAIDAWIAAFPSWGERLSAWHGDDRRAFAAASGLTRDHLARAQRLLYVRVSYLDDPHSTQPPNVSVKPHDSTVGEAIAGPSCSHQTCTGPDELHIGEPAFIPLGQLDLPLNAVIVVRASGTPRLDWLDERATVRVPKIV